ncbi:MAG: class I SAM-dependent methyltransferase [Anaerolineales bacterium]|nr:class I SAM-dependent methyltransferase [Anaerolineales bacterium]
MTHYDEQYDQEPALFGAPYPELRAFLDEFGPTGGTALDLGCGQGRDALLLAEYGYDVIGVDASRVGIAQMEARAAARGLAVTGMVADMHAYDFPGDFDAIVMDSILHFEKQDQARELALLDQAKRHLKPGGLLFLFVHRTKRQEAILQGWLAELPAPYQLIEQRYIDYVYEEQTSGFRSQFQYCMAVVQRLERE